MKGQRGKSLPLTITKSSDRQELMDAAFAKLKAHNTVPEMKAIGDYELLYPDELFVLHKCFTFYLNNLDTSKAYGPDGIPPRLLKEYSKEISSSLCSLFKTGRVPREWKKANVIPIHKKDCVEPVTNYRPISLLPVVSKVLERCVFNNIYPFINNVQHGFLRNRSCVKQLLGVLHDIGKSLDNNRQVVKSLNQTIVTGGDKLGHPLYN